MVLSLKNQEEYKMKIGPKYKIARRLGAPVFEKTQTQKYALSQARKEKTGRRFPGARSQFGRELIEKQKARYTYCLTEKQFSKYAKFALSKKDTHAISRFYEELELRIDNVVYRAGLTPTRMSARQSVSHGHITLNGRRVSIPSIKTKIGDLISIRKESLTKGQFKDILERLSTYSTPNWIEFNKEKLEAKVVALPKYDSADSLFDINVVLEFYSR